MNKTNLPIPKAKPMTAKRKKLLNKIYRDIMRKYRKTFEWLRTE